MKFHVTITLGKANPKTFEATIDAVNSDDALRKVREMITVRIEPVKFDFPDGFDEIFKGFTK